MEFDDPLDDRQPQAETPICRRRVPVEAFEKFRHRLGGDAPARIANFDLQTGRSLKCPQLDAPAGVWASALATRLLTAR